MDSSLRLNYIPKERWHTMKEQTYRNIMYLAGLEALRKLSEKLGWNERQFEAARAALEDRFQPTLAAA